MVFQTLCKAEQDLENFLAEEHTFKEFQRQIKPRFYISLLKLLNIIIMFSVVIAFKHFLNFMKTIMKE